MAKTMWVTQAKSVVKKVLPSNARVIFRPLLRAVDYRLKTHRLSSTDYLAEFDHADVGRARRSILWHDDWEGATRATIEILRSLDVVNANDTVVDFGCGIGRISNALVEGIGPDKVIGVDRSSDMLSHAEEFLPKDRLDSGRIALMSDVDFLGRAEQMSGKLDAILFIEVLHHIPEPILDDMMPKLLSMLNDDGKLFVLGNRLLDVDCDGNTGTDAKPISDFLNKHVEIDHAEVLEEVRNVEDDWQYSFYAPRYLFVCSPFTEA